MMCLLFEFFLSTDIDNINLRPIEKSKIDCAKKLFAKLSNGLVTYDHVSKYQELLNKVLK